MPPSKQVLHFTWIIFFLFGWHLGIGRSIIINLDRQNCSKFWTNDETQHLYWFGILQLQDLICQFSEIHHNLNRVQFFLLHKFVTHFDMLHAIILISEFIYKISEKISPSKQVLHFKWVIFFLNLQFGPT